MDIATLKVGRSDLQSFIGAHDFRPGYTDRNSESQEAILEAFSGTREADFVIPACPRPRTEEYLKQRGRGCKLHVLVFEHPEVALRFMRIDSNSQDVFTEYIVTFFSEHAGVKRLELKAKWGEGSTRIICIEREHSGKGDSWFNLKFSLV